MINPYVFIGIGKVEPKDVLNIVSDVTGYSIQNLRSRSKANGVCDARTLAVAFYLNFGLSLKETAVAINCNNHTSILHHKKKFAVLKKNEADILVAWAKKINDKYQIDLLK